MINASLLNKVVGVLYKATTPMSSDPSELVLVREELKLALINEGIYLKTADEILCEPLGGSILLGGDYQ